MQKNIEETLAENSDPDGYNEDWHNADVICGGFPCQDVSNAGKRAGLSGERSGLWRWLCGGVRLVRPKYAIVENVAALLNRGMGEVLGDLAEIGYDTEWHCIPASAIGAPHERDRAWIIANRKDDVADHWSIRIHRIIKETISRKHTFSWCQDIRRVEEFAERSNVSQPIICRSNDGLSERLHAIGNSVVPDIPEIIGKAILEYERSRKQTVPDEPGAVSHLD